MDIAAAAATSSTGQNKVTMEKDMHEPVSSQE